jgi:hypothetical protein
MAGYGTQYGTEYGLDENPPPAPPPSITTTELMHAFSGLAYSDDLEVVDGVQPFRWEITSGSLPSGLYLNQNNGNISGRTCPTGTKNFTVKVTDAYGQHDSVDLSITVEAGYTRIYFADGLTDGVVGLQVDAPNPSRGFVSEDGTGLSCGAYVGQDNDWYYSVPRRGHLAYKTIPYNLYKYRKWYLELTVVSAGGTANSGTYPLNVIYDTSHWFYTWIGSGGSTTCSFGLMNNGDVGYGSFTCVFPQRIRWVWDVVANTIQGQRWDGSAWQAVHTAVSLPWTPTQFGMGVKNWSGTPAITSKFRDFVMGYDESTVAGRSFDSSENDAGVADSYGFPDRTGPISHVDPRVGRGILLT